MGSIGIDFHRVVLLIGAVIFSRWCSAFQWGFWLVVFLSLAVAGRAAPGDVDPDFKPGVYYTMSSASTALTQVAPLPEGGILLGGFFRQAGGREHPNWDRLQNEGVGLANLERGTGLGQVRCISLHWDGSLWLSHYRGTNPGADAEHLFRLHPDGTVDESFTPQLRVGFVYSLQVQPDGKVLVAGAFQEIGGVTQAHLARLHPDGSLDTSFAPIFNGNVFSVVYLPDGRLLVGGSFTSVNGVTRNRVARLHPDGSLDTNYHPNVQGSTETTPATVTVMALQPDGHVLLGGSFSRVQGDPANRLARLRPDGSRDLAFAASLNNTPYSLQLQADGRIFVAGAFGTIGANPKHRAVVRLLANGTLDTSFASGLTWGTQTYGSYTLYAAALHADGSLLVGGFFPPDGANRSQNLLHRLQNEPAQDELVQVDATRLEWRRGGTAPEISEARFELSTDGGVTWQSLGSGTRMSGGWELAGLSLPPSGTLRAFGRTSSGRYNGSMGLVDQVASYGGGTPELVLEGPAGVLAQDGSAQVDLGATTEPQVFTVRNTGTAPLRLGRLRLTGSPVFRLDTSALSRLLPPGETTEFQVTRVPNGSASPTGTLMLSRDDGSAFSVALRAVGGLSADSTLDSLYLQNLVASPSTPLLYGWIPASTQYVIFVPSDLTTLVVGNGSWYGAPKKLRIEGVDEVLDADYFERWVTLDPVPTPLRLEVTAADGVSKTQYEITIIRSAVQPGEVDLGYAPAGALSAWDGVDYSLYPYTHGFQSLQADGKLLVRTSQGTTRVATDGTEETTFGPVPRYFHTLLPSGQIMVDGSYSSIFSVYEPDGSPNSSFSPVLRNIYYDRSIRPVAQGRLLLSGGLFSYPGMTGLSFGLCRLLPNGALDTSFALNVTGVVDGTALQDDGKILIWSSSTMTGRLSLGSATTLARLHPTGEPDLTFPASQVRQAFPNRIGGIAFQADGKALVYGNGMVKRFLPDWSLDSSFSAPLVSSDEVLGLVVQADGKILLSGHLGTVGSPVAPTLGVRRLQSNGAFDTSLAVSMQRKAAGMAVQADGRILVQGEFEGIRGVTRHGLARLHNDPATEALEVPDGHRIVWLRGGSSPEARRVDVAVSTDDGLTWTELGQAGRIDGGWQLDGLLLPPAGRVRAVAHCESGSGNRSLSLIASQVDYAFTAAPLAWQTDEGAAVEAGATADFGEVGIGGLRRLTWQLHNPGETGWSGLSASLEGAGDFRLLSPLPATLLAGASVDLQVEFQPLKTGLKQAQLRLHVAGAADRLLALQGRGVAASVKPVVKTLAASEVGLHTATLKGTVAGVTDGLEIFFEHGPSGAFGERVPALEGETVNGVRSYSAGLADLPASQWRFFRLRAAGPAGGAVGKTLSFSTGNRPPVAVADQLAVTAGARLTLPIFANDSDPDGEVPTLASFTPLVPASAGKLAKSAGGLVFTAAADFSSASFSYRARDAAGALSEPVEVVLSLPTLSLRDNGGVQPFDRSGTTYQLLVYSLDAWQVLNPLPWVTVEPAEGRGDGLLTVTVAPNLTAKERQGVILIGDVGHDIAQKATTLPVLTQPSLPLPPARVGAEFELLIPTTQLPVSYTVKNLPPGLTIDGASGWLRGVPRQAGSYALEIQARNAAGTSVERVSFVLEVEELPAAFVGRFQGFFPPDGEANAWLGGRYELTTTASGAFTGKAFFGKRSEVFKGMLQVEANAPTEATAEFAWPRKGSPAQQGRLELSLAGEPDCRLQRRLDGETVEQGEGWHIPWDGREQRADVFAGRHHLALRLPEPGENDPTGSGFAVAVVTAASGAVKTAGRLADGTAFTSGGWVGGEGEMLLYQSLYAERGAVAGQVRLGAEGAPATGAPVWVKRPSLTLKDRVHASGFGPLVLVVEGGVWQPPAPGELVMELPNGESDNARLVFRGAGLDFSRLATLLNPSPKGLAHKLSVAAGEPGVMLAKLDAKTGLFSGTLTVSGANKSLDRKTGFFGLITGQGSAARGHGFYVLPAEPEEGQKLNQSPRESGAVRLEPAL
mgnify:CR=1 FL=1